MQFLHILTFLVAALVSYTSAQCQGGAINPNCAGGINLGRSGPSCRAGSVWAWDGRTGQCRRILYRGCGGNRNRWCSQQQCLGRCRR